MSKHPKATENLQVTIFTLMREIPEFRLISFTLLLVNTVPEAQMLQIIRNKKISYQENTLQCFVWCFLHSLLAAKIIFDAYIMCSLYSFCIHSSDRLTNAPAGMVSNRLKPKKLKENFEAYLGGVILKTRVYIFVIQSIVPHILQKKT